MSQKRISDQATGTAIQTGAGMLRDGDRGPVTERDGLTLSEVIASLRRHVLLVLASTAVVGALAAWLVFRELPTYRATAVVKLIDGRRSMTRGLDDTPVDRQEGLDVTRSHVELLKSRALLGSVVDSVGLRLRPAGRKLPLAMLTQVRVDSAAPADTLFLRFSNDDVLVRRGTVETRVPYNIPYNGGGVRFAIKSKPAVDRALLVVAPRAQAVDQLLEDLIVSPRDRTNVVDVGYADVVPEIAQRVVNTLINSFQNVDVQQAQGQSRRRRIFLEEQLREVNAQLAQAEAALSSFRSRQQVFSSRDKLQAEQSALMALDIRRGEIDADRRMYSALLAKLEGPRSERKDDELRALLAAPDFSANPVITQLYTQFSQYQNARDSLTTGEWRATASNPDVARLDQLIVSSEQRLLSAVRGHIATVDARREALEALRANSVTSIEALPQAESAEDRLSRQVASNRLLADRLVEEYQKTRMAEVVEAGQVEIVDLASLPYKRVPRLRALRLLLGLLVGMGIGAVGALLLDSMNARVRGRVDLEDEMQVPVLSVIPQIEIPASANHSLERLSSLIGRRRVPNNRDARSAAGNSTAAGFMSPAGGEAFRMLRSSLKWAQDGAGKTLVISSALSEEGKTTTSANLAVVCALEGKRVLLIDCDLRRPRLHKVFRVPRDPGVAQVLRAGVSPSMAVRDTFITGLSILPAGRFTDTFTDFLGSHPMRELLRTLSEQFDIVIVDTPPVLAVADATAIGPLADGVLFVVGAGATNRRAVEQAIGQLRSAGARVIGAVLNDARGEMERYDRHGYYQYQNSYTQTSGAT
jgi:capsular exopolysaccharide synthesis family protein